MIWVGKTPGTEQAPLDGAQREGFLLVQRRAVLPFCARHHEGVWRQDLRAAARLELRRANG